MGKAILIMINYAQEMVNKLNKKRNRSYKEEQYSNVVNPENEGKNLNDFKCCKGFHELTTK